MECSALFDCFPGQLSRPRHQLTIVEKQYSAINEQPVQSAEDAASQFIDILRTSDKGGKDLERRLKKIVSVNSWTEDLAKYILQGIEALVQHRDTVGQFVREAMDKSTDAAESIFDIAKDHPILVTIVAIGVLVIIAPWVLEALGFGGLARLPTLSPPGGRPDMPAMFPRALSFRSFSGWEWYGSDSWFNVSIYMVAQ
ncbi:hypothetical protein Daus18300_010774 [Diaporthe australafricana]|uniref:Ankyrin repeat protein n=1 Tax=Diaporthe australafricana TaxID=127596 RepID=A0ABR3W9Y1_9PEZI